MPAESASPHSYLSRLRCAVASLLLLCGLGGFAGKVQAGHAALVIDGSTGEVLSAVNADEINHPASLTKMMTLYLAFQALQDGRLKLDEMLPVSSRAAGMAPTKLGLRAGRSVSVRDCILGMITKSANDAATVVAERLGGSEARFVETMNAQALLLGMTHTRFASASGLPDPDDATTARDIGKLAMALYRDFPAQAPYFATREFTFRGRLVRGHNHLMDRYPGMDGLKTGFTNAAGYNLASTAVKDGRRLFGVVLGGRTSAARDGLMAQLLDDGFAHRETSPALVAAAGRPERGVAGRVLAALSPIGNAEAEPAPAHRAHAHAKKKVLATQRHARTAAKSATRACTAGKRKAACPAHKRATHSRHAAQLAKRQGKHVQVAARSHGRDD